MSKISKAVKDTTELLKSIKDEQKEMMEKLDRLTGANPFQEKIMELSKIVFTYSGQLMASEAKLLSELKRFQLEKPNRAMVSIFNKLFGDFLGHINQMDSILEGHDLSREDKDEFAWLKSLHVLRAGFESILAEWGCVPMKINVGEDQFDPDFHEAVESVEEIDPAPPENYIAKVIRRGWTLHGQILQYPQVIVS